MKYCTIILLSLFSLGLLADDELDLEQRMREQLVNVKEQIQQLREQYRLIEEIEQVT